MKQDGKLKVFDKDSPNGKLMIAVCKELLEQNNKHVEKSKLEFAMKYIDKIFDFLERNREVVEYENTGNYIDRIEIKSLEETKEKLVSKLTEKLKQYENIN